MYMRVVGGKGVYKYLSGRGFIVVIVVMSSSHRHVTRHRHLHFHLHPQHSARLAWFLFVGIMSCSRASSAASAPALASAIMEIVPLIRACMQACKAACGGQMQAAVDNIVALYHMGRHCGIHPENCGIHPENLTLNISLQGYSESKLENPMGFEKALTGPAASAHEAFMAKNFHLSMGCLKTIPPHDVEYLPVHAADRGRLNQPKKNARKR